MQIAEIKKARAKKSSPLERFQKKFIKTKNCWVWLGAPNSKGYGRLYDEKKRIYAHRFAYENYIGAIPPGMSVCHNCDNPACVNPRHLFLGTQNDNMQDKTNKNRQAKGSKHGTAKLTEENVLQIKRLLLEKQMTQMDIGRIFNVTDKAISLIACGINWKHV